MYNVYYTSSQHQQLIECISTILSLRISTPQLNTTIILYSTHKLNIAIKKINKSY